MRVLLIKTSSMGDLIHTLPALTDAEQAMPGIRFDWVVEEAFKAIPAWHPSVDRVIPVALRRWRSKVFSADTRAGWKQLREQLRDQHYDMILDAQGLVKSVFLGYLAKGERVGLDWASAREPLASLVYQRKCAVNFYQHAIVRMRGLFGLALGYPVPTTTPNFGVDRRQFFGESTQEKYLVFLFGTTWASKQWPEDYWAQLAEIAKQAGYRVKVSGNNDEEVATARRISQQSQAVDVLPRLSIPDMAALMAKAAGVVSVDTGLGHLSAAFEVPTVSIYGSTNPKYTGALGSQSICLAAAFPCSPCLSRECQYKAVSEVKPACYATVNPPRVWAALQTLITQPV